MSKIKKFHVLLLIFIIALVSYSCNFNEADSLLNKAESLMEQHPDSSLAILNSEIQMANLSRNNYYTYILLETQAKDKNNIDIKNDTLIFQSKDYFNKKNDVSRTALSFFYCGRVLEARKSTKDALVMYLDAEKHSMRTDDNKLKGEIEFAIGAINHINFIKDEAISRFKLSAKYFNIAKSYKNETRAYNRIGSVFLLKQELDSSFSYLNKSLILATKNNDSTSIGLALQNIGLSYRIIKNHPKARYNFKLATTYFIKAEDRSRVQLNIAFTFDDENNKDSTIYYINKSLDLIKGNETSSLRSIILQLQSRIEEDSDNYEKALLYQKNYAEYIQKVFKEANNQALLDTQKKYDFEVIQNENNRLLIEKQSAFLIILILIILVLAMSIFFYRKNVRNKSALSDAELKISQLNDMADSFDEKENSFRKVLLEHFDILKKVALLEGHLRDDEKKQGQKLLKKFNEIVYKSESLDWENLYGMMNQIYNGFPQKLRSKFPQLEEPEVKICCLAFSGLNNTEISILMAWSINTVQMKKSTIRKKLGVEGYGNLTDFLSNNVF